MTRPSPADHVDGVPIYGLDVDEETRCAHYATERDVIAIKFACCGDYYPCLPCHDALTNHEPEQWHARDFGTEAVLCGSCGSELTIQAYLDSGSRCPECTTDFNPRCRTHWPAYFDVGNTEGV